MGLLLFLDIHLACLGSKAAREWRGWGVPVITPLFGITFVTVIAVIYATRMVSVGIAGVCYWCYWLYLGHDVGPIGCHYCGFYCLAAPWKYCTHFKGSRTQNLMTSVAVIGAGAWGTVLANILAKNGHDVTLWCYQQRVADAIREGRHHRLPGIELSTTIRSTTTMADCYTHDLVILGLSSAQLVMHQDMIHWAKIQCPILYLRKVIEPNGSFRMVK